MTGRLAKRLARIEAAAQAREAADDTKLKDYAKVFARARLHLSGRGDEEAGDLTAEDMAAAEAFAEACRRIGEEPASAKNCGSVKRACRRIGEEPSFAALARLVREGVEW